MSRESGGRSERRVAEFAGVRLRSFVRVPVRRQRLRSRERRAALLVQTLERTTLCSQQQGKENIQMDNWELRINKRAEKLRIQTMDHS